MTLARVDTAEPDGWSGLNVSDEDRRKAVRVLIRAGLRRVAESEVPGMVRDIAEVMGMIEPVAAPRPGPVVLEQGMLLEAAGAKVPGRLIRLTARHDTDPIVWVAETVRHPKAPDRVGKTTTIRETALLRDWRVVPEFVEEATP